MRRLTALGIAVLVGVLAAPVPALAGPSAALCAPDNARGGVPADFVLDACVTAKTITLFNDLAVPVVVRATGSLGSAARVQERKTPAASVLRTLAHAGVLLLPGDVVRWPLGSGRARLDAALLQPAAAAAIVDDVASYLPRPGDSNAGRADYAAFAGVVTDVATAIQTRQACVDGKNFLQAEACDVTAASAIGRAAVVQLPQRTAFNLLSVVLETDNWTAWANAGAPLTGATRLVQGARAVAVAAPAARAAAARKVTAAAPHTSAAAPTVPRPPAPAAAAAPRPPAAPSPTVAPRTWRDVLADLLARAQASKGHDIHKGKKKHGD